MKKKIDYPLRNWLFSNDIKGVLFDFDDTLIKTTEIFQNGVQEVIRLYLQALPSLDESFAENIFSKIDVKNHMIHAVNPNRWQPIVLEFEHEIQVQESIAIKALEILGKIYTLKPQFEEDALIVLEILKNWGIVLSLVTHANVEWTLFKLSSLGLDNFFDYVEIVDENQIHKDSKDWKNAANKILLPGKDISTPYSKLLAVGDNIRGDVQAAANAGLRVAWINKKNGWHLYRQGELPKDTIVLNNIGQLLLIEN